jgi:hypothetical protein
MSDDGKEPSKKSALNDFVKDLQESTPGTTEFEKFIGPLGDFAKTLQAVENSPSGQRMKLIYDAMNSPMAKQIAVIAANLKVADERAARLADAIDTATSVGDIQDVIDAQPIDVFTLMALIALERDREAGELEKRLIEERQALNSERGRILAQLAYAETPYPKIKPLVIAFYEEHATTIKADGRPRFKTKATFIKEMLKEHPHVVDPNTIAKWIRESSVAVPHWRKKAPPKKKI